MNKKIACLLLSTLLLASCSYMPSWMGGHKDEKPKLPGERIAALPVGAELAPDADAKDGAPNYPAPVANSEWAQATGGFTAETGHLAGGDFSHKTSETAGDGNKFIETLVPHPIVANGTVFTLDGAGYISAHDAMNIEKIRWKSKGVADKHDSPLVGGGIAYDAGVLYVTSGRGIVAAFDAANGKEKWRKDMHVPLRASPTVSGNQLFVMTMENQTLALSIADGAVLWDHRGISETAGIMNAVSPVIARDLVLVPYSSGELFALSAQTGKELWSDVLTANKRTQAVSDFNGIGGNPVVDGEAVFATGANGVTAAIHIPRGQRVWERQASSINTAWLAGNEFYMLTTDNVLVDFAKYTGHIRWATVLASYEDPDLRLKPIGWRGPVLVDGRLIVVGSSGQLLSVSATDGKILSTVDIPENIYTPPVVANGRLYLVGQDATLYSFQ